MKLSLSRLGVNRRKLLLIIKVGLPAGIQGAIFAISNVLIQSSVNSFGSIAMAGNTASQNIEGLHGFAPDFIGSKAVFSSECTQNCRSGCTEQSVLQPQRE